MSKVVLNKRILNVIWVIQVCLGVAYLTTGAKWSLFLAAILVWIWGILSFYVDKKEEKDKEMTRVARLVLKLKRRELKKEKQ
ncbi:protein BatD [Fructobacillus sp. M2-14]|uniref:Protein BatD n=1 Tax=Fructobacillus broussonetiae TaxID=2713173 RepID=A0ABS5R046_9LACO|nr:hypothetical protein [Fructobacillus broussonetiae]MBS9338823.1 protein BatD [Fructobacillus broussonetiae]